MNYRAKSIGGRLEIHSPKGGGTCVSCYLPDGTLPPEGANNGEKGGKKTFPAKVRKALAALV